MTISIIASIGYVFLVITGVLLLIDFTRIIARRAGVDFVEVYARWHAARLDVDNREIETDTKEQSTKLTLQQQRDQVDIERAQAIVAIKRQRAQLRADVRLLEQ